MGYCWIRRDQLQAKIHLFAARPCHVHARRRGPRADLGPEAPAPPATAAPSTAVRFGGTTDTSGTTKGEAATHTRSGFKEEMYMETMTPEDKNQIAKHIGQ